MQHARAYLADRDDDPGTSGDLQWAVVSRSTGELWGCASLYAIDRARGVASMGYWLIARARGYGTATKAARVLTTWAHEKLRLERIQLTCSPDNDAFRRVAERAGFTLETVVPSAIPFKGRRRDSMLFSTHSGTVCAD